MTILEEVRSSKELLRNLTLREIKGKYKRTALGQLWSLANPIALMIVYSFVFAIVIRVNVPPGSPSGLDLFVIWLLCGLLPWTFFSNVVNGAMDAVTGNENLIKKVYFPRWVLVVSNTSAALYQHALELAILAIAILILGSNILIYIPIVAVTTLMLAFFATGLGFFAAIANVYFRDVQHFMGILFQLGFYASPIVYPVTYVRDVSDSVGPIIGPISIIDIYNLNPFVHFAAIFRNLLYDGRWPDWPVFGIMALASAVVFVWGWHAFTKRQDYLAEVL
ncbi:MULTISPECIES: ABC transporter permease [Trueperella]|uniref:Transport permease protein n=1 Tax=Trueperella bernardiae TaxID=59561 RepID=A0A0W1KJZ6_9ACTO|nr:MULTISPECIES: ABC transporter permease [Trueperella]KTF04099.1 Teichoic acid translocation permease protein TagG [Trueperella bernardiae]MCM3907146.1 ABC transporter permease [Trueperella bernardiae]MDK8601475.1 ABC transporter permease [Trueperella bernardiae]MDV6238349.1 ABC transporter permease [Trueperella bernardiae]OCW60446.1 ABC transporter [Trueperella bernardiae]